MLGRQFRQPSFPGMESGEEAPSSVTWAVPPDHPIRAGFEAKTSPAPERPVDEARAVIRDSWRGRPRSSRLDVERDLDHNPWRHQYGAAASLEDEGRPVPEVNGYDYAPGPHAESTWDSLSTIKEVAVPNVGTTQDFVNSERVKELFYDPDAATRQDEGASGEMWGKPNLPKIYEHWTGEQQVIDGNHRINAAHRRGQMFHPARVIDYDTARAAR